MELWDQNVAPYGEELEALSNSTRADIVLDVVASTILLFEPPFDDFFPEPHRELVKSVLTLRAQAPASWWDDTAFAGDFLTQYDLLPDVPTRPAVGPFLMALVRLFEAPGGFLSADEALECLSSCYEAILVSQLTGRVTAEDEKQDPMCQQAIARQTVLVLRALESSRAITKCHRSRGVT
ncbi:MULTISPECIES: hypothetical protein [unclassified Streptomyces]|uniref:hypothetical protein n=1 Tax=unclassified Streptomyces TaxID=2593676 RepID=UPI002DDC87AC|nr:MULTISPECIES: hypothetical protein [unclassified Streptomyces]WSF81975.1 hypothetical protein OIE70_01490 [Streptomyces sp. NBC_01744]WSC41718.1 hypothetical protein OHA08_43485 [Streptomyces sp. NBC_01763]WSC51139.1 hypothetical protein OG808_01465 [Streptomyces sp. NBC_01761]WSD29686.1 hypothetical protein OHA26_43545 [Streptomyces sp. NBC_01751]WSJ48448.1 hypothetical protein OG243_01560 [Streptomyces sp. NBC_01318]